MSSILISIKNITKKYDIRDVLKSISFDIYSGEIVSLLGINGAGKTTLSNIIATLKKPTSGDIFYNGFSIYKNLEEYRRIIGYCPQTIPIHEKLTIYEALYYSGCLYGMSKEESNLRTLELIQLFELKNHSTKIISNLSGGLKQRVGIARSLLHNPKLIILDEPTVALDSNIRKQLWELLKQLKYSGVSILLITHYLEEAEYLSDKIILLNEGKISSITNPKEFMLKYLSSTLENAFSKFLEDSNK